MRRFKFAEIHLSGRVRCYRECFRRLMARDNPYLDVVRTATPFPTDCRNPGEAHYGGFGGRTLPRLRRPSSCPLRKSELCEARLNPDPLKSAQKEPVIRERRARKEISCSVFSLWNPLLSEYLI